jgi:hypothetical protein
MSSFVKLAAVLSAGLLATLAVAETNKAPDDKSKTPDTKDSKDSGDKPDKSDKGKKDKKDKKKEPKPVADPNAPPATPRPIQLPIPDGHDAKVFTMPYRDADGKLKMRFNVVVATKVDKGTLEMENAQVETFNDQQEHEMTIDLPRSTLNLITWDLTAHKAVSIQRDDFNLTGNSMTFNLYTKEGGLADNVRMEIYDLQSETGGSPSDRAAAAEKGGADKPASPAADNSAAPAAAATPATPEPKAK